MEELDKYMKENYGIEMSEFYSESELNNMLKDDDVVSICEWFAEKHDLVHL